MKNIESPHFITKQEGGFETVENRHEAFGKLAETFRKRLIERFGKNGTEGEMSFHNLAHSEGVARGAVEILKRIQKIDKELKVEPGTVTDQDIEFAYVVGLGHDLVQKATLEEGKVRARHRGFKTHNKENLEKIGAEIGNEEATAIEIWKEMKKYRDPKGNFLFPENDFKEKVFEAIGATYPHPEFGVMLPEQSLHVHGKKIPDERLPMKSGPKFSQPELTEESSLITLAIAQADLRGPCGAVEDPAVFQKTGDAEFYELNTETIVKEARGGVEYISPERRVVIAQEIVTWIRSQVGFAMWQRELFHKALDENLAINTHKKENERLLKKSPHAIPKTDIRAETIKSSLSLMFQYFDSNIIAAYERYERIHDEFQPLIDSKTVDTKSLKKLLIKVHIIT
ncbi:MAG: hypothetical protein HYT93_04235 [Parcubacteria group bacterium]|nr:hypothetical protein [Parcubacteria group bacterium]